MKKILVLTFLILSLILSAEEKENIKTDIPALAVIDFEPKGVKENLAEFLTEQIRIELFKKRKYKILERSKIAGILNEQKMQLNGLSGSNYTIKVGELLAANSILTGNINRISDKVFINAKLVEVQTGIMEWGNTYEVRSEDEIIDKAKEIADDLTEMKIKTKNQEYIAQNKKENDENEETFVLNNTGWTDDIGKVGAGVGSFVRESVDYFLKKAQERRDEIEQRPSIEKSKKNEKLNLKNEKTILVRVGPKFKRSNKELSFSQYNSVNRIDGNAIWMGGFLTIGNENGFSLGGGGAGTILTSKNDNNIKLGMGYGGPIVSLNRKLGPLRINGDILIGAGGFSVDNDSYKNDIGHKPIDSGAFFVVEPAGRLGIEPFMFFEMGIEYSYLYSSVDTAKIDISSSNVGVYFAFGY